MTITTAANRIVNEVKNVNRVMSRLHHKTAGND